MVTVQEAQQAVTQAETAYKASNKDKALKKALKAAKAALAEAEAKQAAEAAAPAKLPKKKKAEALSETPAEAPKAKKQKKTETPAPEPEPEPEKPKKKKDKKNKAAEEPTAAPAATDVLAGLKSNKRDRAAADGSAPAKKPAEAPAEKSNKVFAGNLSFQIDDDKIKEFFKDCGTIVDIKWLEHKDTKRFKGCGFLTFDSVESAEKAVAKNGENCMDRPISLDFSKPLSGEREGGGAKKGGNKPSFIDQPLSERPEGCTTCFVGNVSFQCEEDDMRAFAADCGTIKNIRWVYHKDTGNFKGCGFVEFEETAAVDKFVKKNGQDLKGRPLRIDYSKARGE